MQIAVEIVSKVERRVTIEVPADQVDAAYKKKINELAKNVNLKGFRPGKVPIDYVEQRFGQEARVESLNELIQTILPEVLKKENLNPVSMPQVTPKKIAAIGEPFEFTATFEIIPEMGPIQFSIDQIEKPIVEINRQDIERVMSQLLKQYTQWNVVNRPAQEKDRVVIDYQMILDGDADAGKKVESFPVELGSKTMIPGFEAGLINAKTDEEKSLKLTFPADYHDADKANKPVEFIIKVKQIFEPVLPALDETFIKQFGVDEGTKEALEEQIKHTLEFERDQIIKEKIKEQVFSRLHEQNPIDLPNVLVEEEARRIHDQIYQHQAKHDHEKHSNKELATFKEIAKKRVALGLLVAEYAKQFNVNVDKAKVNARIAEIASVYDRPQEVETWLASAEKKGEIEMQVLEDEVLEKLMTDKNVIEKTLSYAELKGIREE